MDHDPSQAFFASNCSTHILFLVSKNEAVHTIYTDGYVCGRRTRGLGLDVPR